MPTIAAAAHLSGRSADAAQSRRSAESASRERFADGTALARRRCRARPRTASTKGDPIASRYPGVMAYLNAPRSASVWPAAPDSRYAKHIVAAGSAAAVKPAASTPGSARTASSASPKIDPRPPAARAPSSGLHLHCDERAGSKPGGIDSRRLTLLSNSPAPISSTTASPPSMTTSRRRGVWCLLITRTDACCRPITPLRGASSAGSNWWRINRGGENDPMANTRRHDSGGARQDDRIQRENPPARSVGQKQAECACADGKQPAFDNELLDGCLRPAPSAARMANSPRRAALRASCRPATLTHALRSSNSTADTARSAGRTSLVTSS